MEVRRAQKEITAPINPKMIWGRRSKDISGPKNRNDAKKRRPASKKDPHPRNPTKIPEISCPTSPHQLALNMQKVRDKSENNEYGGENSENSGRFLLQPRTYYLFVLGHDEKNQVSDFKNLRIASVLAKIGPAYEKTPQKPTDPEIRTLKMDIPHMITFKFTGNPWGKNNTE